MRHKWLCFLRLIYYFPVETFSWFDPLFVFHTFQISFCFYFHVDPCAQRWLITKSPKSWSYPISTCDISQVHYTPNTNSTERCNHTVYVCTSHILIQGDIHLYVTCNVEVYRDIRWNVHKELLSSNKSNYHKMHCVFF